MKRLSESIMCAKRAVLCGRCENNRKKTALNGTALALGRINTEIDF